MKRLLILGLLAGVLVLLLWKLFATLAATFMAARFLHGRTSGPRRRRPKASWPKLIEAGSLAAVAWNTRNLNGGRKKVTPGFTLGLGRRLRKQTEQVPWEGQAP